MLEFLIVSKKKLYRGRQRIIVADMVLRTHASKEENPIINELAVLNYLKDLFESDLHAKRVLSLANGTLGLIRAASLSIHAIGHGLAQVRGIQDKHGVKQVDRLLSNMGIDLRKLASSWIPYVLGNRTNAYVVMDWTDFDSDNQATICLYLVTKHGRATPLAWRTVDKSNLKGWRNAHEDDLLVLLHECVPTGVQIHILADRGFGDVKLYELLRAFGFEFTIRFRKGILVTDEHGETRTAGDWVPGEGQAKLLRGARLTAKQSQVGAVVCVKAKGMKEAWCLATSDSHAKASEIKGRYSWRFSIEETFRDQKDIRFGMGLSTTHIGVPGRRDRLLMLCALAQALLTLLGEAGESLGMEKYLKANTSKKRTYSLFRQGILYYLKIPVMKEDQLRPLIQRFGELLSGQPLFTEIFGAI